MYSITCDGYPLLDWRDDSLVLVNPKVNLEVNTVGEGSFVIYNNHPHYDKLKKLKSVFEITDGTEVIFRGRATGDTIDFNHGKAVDLEGAMAFFNDSIVRPFRFPDDFLNNAAYVAAANSGNVIKFFLGWLIDNHSSQVQDFQKMKLGNVTVSDADNYITRSSTGYASTWDTLKSRLFDSPLGGYLCIRYEDDGNYIDYLSAFESTNTQQILFGENLLDLTNETAATETYSAIVPMGEGGLTIAGLPDGDLTDDIVKTGDTLYSKKAVAEYGWIYAPTDATTWDIKSLEVIQTKGVDWLSNEGIMLSNTIEATAVDLHFTDEQIRSLRIYKNVNVYSEPHGLSKSYPLARLEIDLLNPQNTKITAGETRLTLIDKQNATSTEVGNIASKISVVDVKTWYYKSTSNATLSEGNWVPEKPVRDEGTYIWTKDVITYSDGSEYESAPNCATGDAGVRGTGLYIVTTAPSGYTVISGGFKPTYRIDLNTVKSQSGATEILIGDNIRYSYYLYPVGHVDNSYVYMGERTSIRGETGDDGVGVSSVKSQFYLSDSKTKQSGGSWVDTMPTWSNGKYLWIRSAITYTDGKTEHTEPVCDSSWEAVNDLDAALTQENVFNRLTNNGVSRGVYMENGQLYINASYLKSGLLAADRINVTDLFAKSIQVTGDIHTIASKTWKASDYTQDDYRELQNILMRIGNEGYTPTYAELDKYDFDQDGNLYLDDGHLYWMIELGVDITVEWKVKIDPNDKDSMIKAWKVYHGPNGMGNIYTRETVVLQVGASGTRLYANDLRNYGDLVVEGHGYPKIRLKDLDTGNEVSVAPVYVGTETFTTSMEGELHIPYSALGIKSRPSVVIATPQSFQGWVNYMWDDSYEMLRLIVIQRDEAGTGIVPIPSGATIRLGLVIYS